MEENKDTKIDDTKVDEIKEENKEQKTFSQSEFDSAISKMYEKFEEKFNKRAETARAEAEKLAQMSAEEKFKYQLEQREKELAEKEKNWILKENEYQCSQILEEKGLPIKFASFCVAEDADTMQKNISLFDSEFKKAVKLEVEKRLGSTNPKTGTIGLEQDMTKEKLAKLPYDQQMAYLKEHPDFL